MSKRRIHLYIDEHIIDSAETWSQRNERSLSYVVTCLLSAWVEECEKSGRGSRLRRIDEDGN